MDYREEPFFRMQQFDTPKVPFYMSYPMQNLYLTEMEYEKDMDRMKELYPRDVARIMEVIEDECDKMEYEGSLMFDEYPDRLMLEQVTERIYQTVKMEQIPLRQKNSGEAAIHHHRRRADQEACHHRRWADREVCRHLPRQDRMIRGGA